MYIGLTSLLILTILVFFYFFVRPAQKPGTISNFDECVKAGYAILESYPPQCVTKDGKSFTQDIGNELEKTDQIQIDAPRPNAEIESFLKITGKAQGSWFFEGSFPVKLYAQDGKLLASTTAQAQGDWMTEDFVPFTAMLKFDPPSGNKGKLVLEKDNPSGLPENADSLYLPVVFK